MNRNVVITGLGILSPIGIGKESYWESLLQSKTGFKKITLFDTSSLNVHIAGEITDFDPVVFLGKKGLRTLDRSTRLINSAAKLAVEDAALQITDKNTHFTGVSIGTTFGSLHSISQFDREGLIEGPKYVNPSHFPNTVINSPASQISIRFKIKGFNTTISTGFCASLDAVSYAADFIKLNRADIVLTGGVEELCEETFLGFYNLGCLSGTNGLEPICCPFDVRRNGIILSEGATVLILEDEEHALRRSATIIAKISGYANSFDPSPPFNSPLGKGGHRGVKGSKEEFIVKGNGLKNAIALALQDASIEPEDIDYISSCANSTVGLDSMETKVIKEVFGNHAYNIPVSSIKSMVGESFSASGALSLVAAIGAIEKNIIPPTVNYLKKDPECDLDYVPNAARQKNVNNLLVISSDPYGQNSAIVVGRYKQDT